MNESTAWQYLNRTYVAQITHVDPDKGTCDVAFLDNLLTTREGLELPMHMSMRGLKSSWMRYIPQVRSVIRHGEDVREGVTTANGDVRETVGDLVYVCFGPQGQAYIVGYASQPGLYADFMSVKDSHPTKIPNGELVNLKPGEWDLRSSGGANIYGDEKGTLLLAAGPRSQLRFIKAKKEARGESGLWELRSTGSFLRVGDVKRKPLPTDFSESDQSTSVIDPLGNKEYWLHLSKALPAGVQSLLVDEQMGTVRDDQGVARTGGINPLLPLRSRKKIWSAISTQGPLSTFAQSVFSSEIDSGGNHEITYTPSVEAPVQSVQVSGVSADISVDALNVSANGTATASLTSDAVTTIDAPLVRLGELASTNFVMHGTTYVLVSQPMWVAMAAFMTAAATYIPKIASDNKHVDPSSDPVAAAAQAMAAAATTMAPIFTQLATSALTPGPTGLLSTKVLVE